MLFNSPVFIFVFLPVVLVGYYSVAQWNTRFAAAWLAMASLVFYGWWNPRFLVLLGASITFNFCVSVGLRAFQNRSRLRNGLLALAITSNLLVLFYYKYLTFSLSLLAGFSVGLPSSFDIVLPLGLSFYTFTQIGYLVDCAQGAPHHRGFLEYVLFVTFFPHLIAGPILHHREIMPQFARPETYRFGWEALSTGGTVFFLGLIKKVVLADSLIEPINQGFSHAPQLGIAGAWLTAIGFSLQLYFDFSAYSDMAIGLACMFNIRFPLNFNSPYKSRSVIEFWQRWHITLTRYLMSYVYNPLALYIARRRAAAAIGGSAPAPQKKSASVFVYSVGVPTLVTMLVAGIWHGAGLQFVVFGLLHAFYLIVNHAWRLYGPTRGRKVRSRIATSAIAFSAASLTYMAVVIADVFFRASSLANAMAVVSGMAGFHGGLHELPWDERDLLGLLVCGVIAFGMPNIYQLMRDYPIVLGPVKAINGRRLIWQPSLAWAAAGGVIVAGAIANLWNVSEFIYFQF